MSQTILQWLKRAEEHLGTKTDHLANTMKKLQKQNHAAMWEGPDRVTGVYNRVAEGHALVIGVHSRVSWSCSSLSNSIVEETLPCGQGIRPCDQDK